MARSRGRPNQCYRGRYKLPVKSTLTTMDMYRVQSVPSGECLSNQWYKFCTQRYNKGYGTWLWNQDLFFHQNCPRLGFVGNHKATGSASWNLRLCLQCPKILCRKLVALQKKEVALSPQTNRLGHLKHKEIQCLEPQNKRSKDKPVIWLWAQCNRLFKVTQTLATEKGMSAVTIRMTKEPNSFPSRLLSQHQNNRLTFHSKSKAWLIPWNVWFSCQPEAKQGRIQITTLSCKDTVKFSWTFSES